MESKHLARIATLLVAGLLSVTTMFAQSLPIKGRVTDSEGAPVIGAYVVAEGTNASAMTDSDGHFSLSVPEKANTLLFQMLGMEDTRVAIDRKRGNYEVTMAESQNYLDEAVAIGYGTIIRRDLTSSVSSVNSEQLIERASAFNVTQALAGKVAGYTVYNISGRPGGSNTVRVRGTGSVNASSEPLYVVDGVVDVSIDMINPNDIESIDVLKDAAATAMYGAKGANGVVLVTTKTGKSGEGTVVYNGSVGVSMLNRVYEELTGDEYLSILRDAYAYSGKVYDPYFTTPYEKLFDYQMNADGSYATDAAGLLIPTAKYNTQWMKEYYKTGVSTDHNLSFSKAGEKNSVYASVGYKYMDGIIRNTDANRVNAALTFTSKINKWIDARFGANLSTSRQMRNDICIDGSIYNVIFDSVAPFIPYKYPDGTYGVNGDHLTMASTYDYNRVLDESFRRQTSTHLVVNGQLDFHLLPGLDLTVKGDYQTRTYLFEQMAPPGIPGATVSNNGFTNVYNSNSIRWSNEDYLTYNKSFFQDRFKTTTVLGTSFYSYRFDSSSGGSTDLPDEVYEYIRLQYGQQYDSSSSGYDKQTMHSVYFRTNWSWAGKYLFGFTMRADGASNFGDNNKYGYFPSASAGWVISEEPWFEPLKETVSLFKLRASYGSVGNASIPSYRTFDRLSLTGNVVFNKEIEATATNGEPGNKDLQWETSTQLDLGFDLSLWKDRVNLVADFYNRDTENLLYTIQVPNSTGYSSTWSNIGKIRNRGFELTLNTHPIDKPDFKWDMDLVYSNNTTKAIDINGDRLYSSLVPILNAEGEEWRSMWVFETDGVWQLDEVEEAKAYGFSVGDVKFVDRNGDGELTDEDRYVLGRTTPRHEFSFVNTFYWKGFSLMVDLAAKTGFYIYNGHFDTQYLVTDNPHVTALYAWTPNNQNTVVPANRTTADAWPWNGLFGDMNAYKGDYLQLRNISLSYDLKRNVFRKVNYLKGVSVGILAENIATFTKAPVLTAEDAAWGNSTGVVGGTYPRSMSLSGTLKLTF